MALQAVTVPDIGDFKDVPILEILVKSGDSITIDQSIITLESDKATMEIPSSHIGIVQEIKVAVGDKVSAGSVILILDTTTEMAATSSVIEPVKAATIPSSPTPIAASSSASVRNALAATPSMMMDLRRPKNLPPPPLQSIADQPFTKPHAGPAVRHLARE